MRRIAGVLALLAGLGYLGFLALFVFLLSQAARFDAVAALVMVGANVIGAIASLGAAVSLLRNRTTDVTNLPLLSTGLVVVVSVLIAVLSPAPLQLTYAVLGVLALIAAVLLLIERRGVPGVGDST